MNKHYRSHWLGSFTSIRFDFALKAEGKAKRSEAKRGEAKRRKAKRSEAKAKRMQLFVAQYCINIARFTPRRCEPGLHKSFSFLAAKNAVEKFPVSSYWKIPGWDFIFQNYCWAKRGKKKFDKENWEKGSFREKNSLIMC